jgi:hypothetical protein
MTPERAALEALVASLTEHIEKELRPGNPMLRFWRGTLQDAMLARSGHDSQCESELTSHGYTPCRCHERAGICYCRKNPCICLPSGGAGEAQPYCHDCEVGRPVEFEGIHVHSGSAVTCPRWKPSPEPRAEPPVGEVEDVLIHGIALTTAREHLTDPDTEKRDEQRAFGEAELMDVAMDAIREFRRVSASPASTARDRCPECRREREAHDGGECNGFNAPASTASAVKPR